MAFASGVSITFLWGSGLRASPGGGGRQRELMNSQAPSSPPQGALPAKEPDFPPFWVENWVQKMGEGRKDSILPQLLSGMWGQQGQDATSRFPSFISLCREGLAGEQAPPF